MCTDEKCLTSFRTDFEACFREKIVQLSAGRSGTMYSVTPSFYELWKAIAGVEFELFVDALNESGVLEKYCSLDEAGASVRSVGAWEGAEPNILGGAGNPPFDTALIEKLLDAFETRVQGMEPLFRAVLLPGANMYKVRQALSDDRSHGRLLVAIPAKNIGFAHQPVLLPTIQDKHFPRPFWKESLLSCAWANSAYLVLRPPAWDVEERIAAWIMHACQHPNEVIVNYDECKRVFPHSHRSDMEVADWLTDDLPS